MPRKSPSADTRVYQLKVTLRRLRPPVWRRLLVTSDTTLAKLHRVLQVAMPWTESHLHQFIVGQTYYSDLRFEVEDTEDESRVSLREVAPAVKRHFLYEYDFGDGWEHDIAVEEILPAEPGKHYPVCTGGKRACPPDDCGGVWGYVGMLEAIQDEEHPDHEMMLEWIGGEWDPEHFDLESINEDLRRLH